MNSPLARFAHLWSDPNEVHARAAAASAWRDHGILLINPAWLGCVERQQITNIADKLHGKRRG